MLQAPQNVIIASVPTVFDPSLAPPGKAVVHCYSAANEPYALWQGMRSGSPEYESLKVRRGRGGGRGVASCAWIHMVALLPGGSAGSASEAGVARERRLGGLLHHHRSKGKAARGLYCWDPTRFRLRPPPRRALRRRSGRSACGRRWSDSSPTSGSGQR